MCLLTARSVMTRALALVGYVRLPPTALRMVLEADVPDDAFISVRAVGSGRRRLRRSLMEYLGGRLASYQRPVAIRVVQQLPRTPTLKVSRALVRER